MRIGWLLLAWVFAAVPVAVRAEAYPDRPVRMIVGFPAGGAADIIARIVGQKLTQIWGQQIVVDNRPGAGSTIGSDITAKSAPNGYSLLMISSSHAASAGLYKTSYKPVDSFAPVTLVATAPQVLLASPSFPIGTIQALLSAAKASPGKFNYGSAGTGSTTHLAGELLRSMTAVNIVHVPFKGGAPAIASLMGNQIHLLFLALPPALPQIRAGRVKAIAVTSAKRSPALPDVAAIAEAVPGYEAVNWYGILAPAGTPAAIVAKINKDTIAALRDEEVARSIVAQGADVVGSTPQYFTDYLRSEISKWTKLIRSAGIQVQ